MPRKRPSSNEDQLIALAKAGSVSHLLHGKQRIKCEPVVVGLIGLFLYITSRIKGEVLAVSCFLSTCYY